MGVADENWGSKKRDLYSMFGDQRRRVAPGLYEEIDRQWRQKYLQANMWTKKDMSYHLFHLWDNPEFRKDRLNIFRRYVLTDSFFFVMTGYTCNDLSKNFFLLFGN